MKLTADSVRVPANELAAAHAKAGPTFLEAIRRIRENILRFQTAILHKDVQIETPHGGYLRQRYLPLARIGICVPGGAAAYPSTVLMTAVPAQAAGVERDCGRRAADAVRLVQQRSAGHVPRTGHHRSLSHRRCPGGGGAGLWIPNLAGAPLVKVDKIVGPGNLFVALAKKHVYGDVGIDSIAGPSEVIVIADETTPATFVASDLIAQAEHAPGSSVLITWSQSLWESVASELEVQLATLERGGQARESLEAFGCLILVADREEAAKLANTLATEHLHLACADAEELAAKIHCAGAVFIGPYSPVALGDYVAGPSHVLPTGSTARFASGLSSNDFLRSSSVIHFSPEGVNAVADDVVLMAKTEGLTAHAASVLKRQNHAGA